MDLLKRHKATKEKLNKIKEESEKQKQIECPFQPSKKKLEKFVIQGDVIRRNEMWYLLFNSGCRRNGKDQF